MVIMVNKVNFDEVVDKGIVDYIKVPGSYTVKIKEVVRKQSKKGNDMDVYTLETRDGEGLFLRLALSEKSLFRYKEFIRAVRGLDARASVGEVDLDTFPETTVGKKITIVVGKQAPVLNIETGLQEESPYLEIKQILPVV